MADVDPANLLDVDRLLELIKEVERRQQQAKKKPETTVEKIVHTGGRCLRYVEGVVRPLFTNTCKALDHWAGRIDHFLRTTDPSSKYFTEVLLRLPLVYLIHCWFLLAPASDYRLVDLVFALLRYFTGFMLFGTWAFGPQRTFRLYAGCLLDCLVAWCMNASYEIFQSEADGVCLDGISWGRNLTLYLLIQVAYNWYFAERFQMRKELGDWSPALLLIYLVPFVLCFANVGTYYMAPVYYHLSRLMFFLYLFTQAVVMFSDSGIDTKNPPPLPGKWFTRDVLVLFGVTFYTGSVVYEMVRLLSVSSVLNPSFLADCMGAWCTSVIVLAGLAACFSILSNVLVAGSRFFITGGMDRQAFVQAFDANIGGRVNISMTVFALEAGILICSTEERIENMKSVMFLAFYVIICQAWDVTEPYFHHLVNSGETGRRFTYIRVILFSVVIATVPALWTYRVSEALSVDLWLLLNASGCLVVISRVCVSFVEYCLVSASWRMDENLHKMEDAIYYVRVFKSLSTVICTLMLGYYRLIAPFFGGNIVFRALVICSDALMLSKNILYKEWIEFQQRRTYARRVDGLDNATEEQLKDLDDVCSVCYLEMHDGKVLPCSHIFHTNCLRKWFQIKTVCPICNIDAAAPRASNQGEKKHAQ